MAPTRVIALKASDTPKTAADQVRNALKAADMPKGAADQAGLTLESVLLLTGDFDAGLNPKVRSILSRAVAPLAVFTKTLIIDNGAATGTAGALGLAAADQDDPPMMLAIVASGAAAVEPHRPLAMSLPAEWTEITKSTFQIVGELANVETENAKPVAAMLFGGSDADLPALMRSTRRKWPILVVAGSGGLADRIVAALRKPPEPAAPPQPEAGPPQPQVPAVPPQVPAAPTPPPQPSEPQVPVAPPQPPLDPVLNEILQDGRFSQIDLDGDIDDLKRILGEYLEPPLRTMADAWARYDDLDWAAILRQRSFKRIQMAVLLLGLTATFLAIVQSNTAFFPWLRWVDLTFFNSGIANLDPETIKTLSRDVRFLLVLVPILITILVSTNSRFREGIKWILVRSAAEAIKAEIFRYRARSGAYSDKQCVKTSREACLSTKLKEITTTLVSSEVNKSTLERIPIDDLRRFKKYFRTDTEKLTKAQRHAKERIRFLTGDEYLVARVEDQIEFMIGKTARLFRQLKRDQIAIYVAGGLGTLLAAVEGGVWVALTTAFATALTSKLDSEQVENSLVQYNLALVGLKNIRTWWKALNQWEKERPANIDLLVDQTEQVMQIELQGWAQQLQSALDKQTERKPEGSGEAPSSAPPAAAPAPGT